jgi:hypothetical protein
MWGCQVLLQVFKCLLCLLSPLELVLFLEELKQRESPDAESRDVMRTSILRLQSFLPLRYLALSHDHEHNN